MGSVSLDSSRAGENWGARHRRQRRKKPRKGLERRRVRKCTRPVGLPCLPWFCSDDALLQKQNTEVLGLGASCRNEDVPHIHPNSPLLWGKLKIWLYSGLVATVGSCPQAGSCLDGFPASPQSLSTHCHSRRPLGRCRHCDN